MSVEENLQRLKCYAASVAVRLPRICRLEGTVADSNDEDGSETIGWKIGWQQMEERARRFTTLGGGLMSPANESKPVVRLGEPLVFALRAAVRGCVDGGDCRGR